jgi:hypothetical protein
MFNQILPRQVDNTYRGYKLALWLFGLLVLMKAGISLGTIFNGYTAASSADGIPLDLLALCFGVGPISRNGLLHVCAALAGASEQKTDSSDHAH